MIKFCETKDFNDIEKPLINPGPGPGTYKTQYNLSINEIFTFHRTKFRRSSLFPKNHPLKYKQNSKTQMPIYIDKYTTNYLTKNNLIVQEDFIDIKWFISQNNYLNNLELSSQFILYGYTLEEGYSVINSFLINGFDIAKEKYINNINKHKEYYLRGNSYFPFYFQLKDSIRELDFKYISSNKNDYELINKLKNLINEIDNDEKIYGSIIHNIDKFISNDVIRYIIDNTINTIDSCIINSPITENDMYVYRGTSDKYIIDSSNTFNTYNSNNIQAIHPSIMSTSISISTAKEFMYIPNETNNNEPKCCLKIIKVPKGSRVLFLSPISNYIHEVEILFASNSKFKIKSLNKEMNYISENTMSNGDYFENIYIPPSKIIVSEIEFLGYN
jgi:hypothetical protein